MKGRVIEIRGFSNQRIERAMLFLTEEIYDTIESEVADVFIVLCTICNKLNIDLFSSLKDKEKENIERKWKK